MKRTGAIAGLVLAMASLTACGGGSDTDKPKSATAVFDESATLRYASTALTNSFDPPRVLISQYNAALFLAYDRLVHVDPEGNAVPGLATSWEFGEGNTSLTFTLREGAKFQDGTELDAEVVKANLERSRDLADSQVASLLAVVENITVDSKYQITLELNAPSPGLPLMLSERTGAIVNPKSFADDGKSLQSMSDGIGMYRVEKFVPDDRIVFVRNEDYWDADAAKAAKVEMIAMIDPRTRLNAIRSGQVDWVVLDSLDHKTVANDSKLEVEVFSSLAYRNIPMNMSRPGMDDARVRQALNIGLDRKALSQVFTDGLGQPCTQPFPEGYSAHNAEVGCDAYPYDKKKAKELLAEAGWGDGKLKVEILTAGYGVSLAEALQAQWKEIGVESTITNDAAAAVRWNTSGDGTVFTSTWGGRNSAYETLFNQFTSGGPFNEGQYKSEAVDAAYEAALLADTEEAQNKALQVMVKAVSDEAMDIALWADPIVLAYSPKVVGVEQWATKQEFRGVGISK